MGEARANTEVPFKRFGLGMPWQGPSTLTVSHIILVAIDMEETRWRMAEVFGLTVAVC